jgi:hypothetical protein
MFVSMQDYEALKSHCEDLEAQHAALKLWVRDLTSDAV